MVDRYETVVTKLGHEVDLAYVEQRDGTVTGVYHKRWDERPIV